MASNKGVLPVIKGMVPPGVRTALKQARRRLRDRFKLARERLARPNLYRLDTAERVGVVFTCQSDMRIDERLFLYSFVRGFQPERALEIGVLRGGSAAIITNAMEENGRGKLVGIDPAPEMAVKERDLHGRYTLLREFSPQAIPAAREAAPARGR